MITKFMAVMLLAIILTACNRTDNSRTSAGLPATLEPAMPVATTVPGLRPVPTATAKTAVRPEPEIDPDLFDFTLAGQASLLSDRLRLVLPDFSQVGAAWYTPAASEQHNVANGFNAIFDFRITSGTSIPADGFAFVIQNESTTAIGSPRSPGYPGISNSIAIEFDTFQNPSNGDASEREIAVMTMGVNPNSQSHFEADIGSVKSPIDFADGEVHTARIQYTPGAPGTLNVYLDDLTTPILSVPLDLAATINLNDGSAWVGMTAATGGLFSNHDILAWEFN